MRPDALEDLGKLVLRLTLGTLILFHGLGKVAGGVGPIPDLLGAIGLPAFFAYGVYLGEVLGPVLLIVGWYARLGAGLIAVNMLFAFALAHSNELLQMSESGGWQLELQGMFLFTAIALALTGPGRFSVDRS